MSRKYSVIFSQIAVTALQDFFELNVGANNPCELTGLHIGQSTDAGDAEDEQLAIAIIRGNATSGSGGAAVTPAPLDNGDTAAAATAERNNTTEASTGTPITLLADAFNVRGGYVWTPTPEQYINVDGSQRIVVRLLTAPADSLSVSATLFFIEH